ncbi:tyrosine-type recombinase/integrase [Bradyrhizobium elkanii]|uniref:tyrosine-type recombinase/integrase n=1 Tax=Bradyrhizobium elkanii TaxID=29448 RepID=UPI00144A1614|nr:site-specific integrase [Bradyrhizobium elkanii]MCS3577773.1 integrase [Bradyrhizobium elkanii]MCS3720648.1 integrase [Bradyrhizobium elkanii]MCS4005065.1 integrase [Bradyrhizobium elkanii USDA 61]BBC00210.1 integrase [Bradyrhizobium elkanii USDA 61]
MGRVANKLSVNFTKKNDLEPGLYGDGNGLYLQVSKSSTKAWVFRFMIAGVARKMGLGDYDRVSLAEARKKATAAHLMVVDGIDPIADRDARKAAQAAERAEATSFGECALGYIEAHQAGWKNSKHAAQWKMTLLGVDPKGKPAKNDYCKLIRNLPVGAINDAHVMKVLQPIWLDKTETASRVRGRIEKVLDRAKALKLRSGENPARWVGHLDQLLPSKSQVAPVENYPALPYREIPEFMAELRHREGVGARALEYTILTAARTSETIDGTRAEVDKHAKLWTVPKERMKGKRGARKSDHVVPLTRQALAILQALPREAEHLFAGAAGEPLSNAAMAAVIDRMNEDRAKAGLPKWVDPQQGGREIVPHGFRSTFKDWCSDMTRYPNEMSEVALSHAVDDKVERAYRRGNMLEKRRRMMQDWANYCSSAPVPVAATVLPIRSA